MAKNVAVAHAKGNSKLGKRIRDRWQLYLLLLLPVAWLILFAYVPMTGIVIAFEKYKPLKGIFGSTWVGLKNFQDFFGSYKAGMVIKNTLTVSLYSLVVTFPIPILFALLLNVMPGVKYKKAIQTVTYIPYFFSSVVMVGLLYQIIDYRNGLFGTLYKVLAGTTAPNLLENGSNFFHLYVWSAVWQNTGYSAIIYIAALSSCDQSLHEAAMIDGASRLQRVIHIDVPCILPTVSIMLVLAVGNIMNVGYEKVLLMQNNLNANYSEIISTYAYKIGLVQANNFGQSTAISLFNSVVNFILLITANFASNKMTGSGIF